MMYVVYFGNWDCYEEEARFNSKEEAEQYIENYEYELAPEEYFEIEVEE